jgi:hypothetical protein
LAKKTPEMKRNFQFSIFNFQNLILLVILGLAAFLRLYRIQDYMTFLGDEGRDVLVAYNILHGHLTLLGPTSSVGGFFLGPIYYYFMAPFLWLFNYNPVGPAVMVALFGIATVWLIYKFCGDLFSQKVGLIAACLYAVSPLIINYSHSSWNPNLVPFFSLLILYVLALQLHYLVLFLGVIVGIYVLLSRKFSLLTLVKKYSVLFSGFLIGWSPLIAFEIRHGFVDFKNISTFILHSGNTGANSNFFLTISDVFFRLFARLVGFFPAKEQLGAYSALIINIWLILIILIAVASVLLLVINLYKNFKLQNENYRKFLLLSIWFLVGVLLFGFYKKPIYDYYFAFMFPLPFILVGGLLMYIYENKMFQTAGKALAIIIFVSLFILNLWGMPFRYEPNRQLNQMRTIAQFVMLKTDVKPFNFAIITGGNSDYAYRYFFTVWGRPPTTIQNSVADPQRKTVTDQLFVVCESLPCKPLGHSLWEIAGFGRADIAGHWNVSVVEIYKLIHYKGK